MIRVDLDTNEVGADEISVVSPHGRFEMIADGLQDKSFNLGRRYPRDGTRALGLSLQQGRGDIITVPDAKLAGMAWAHPIATVVVDAADQQSLGFGA